MKIKVFKPISKFTKQVTAPTYTSQQPQDIIQNVFYGMDVSKLFAIRPFTLGGSHQNNGSILAIFDEDSTTSYHVFATAPNNTSTTEIIFDVGRILRFRGTTLSFSYSASGGTGGSLSIKTEYSKDNQTWVTIATTTGSSPASDTYRDHLLGETDYRFIRVTFYNLTNPAISYNFRFYQFDAFL